MAIADADLPQFYLLVALYFVQGIPVGLAFGTVPFLLKSMAKYTSFTSLGIFSMATYPYSLKIWWSPIVDSFYIKKIGRRRTWIIPVQLVSGVILFILGMLISKDILFQGVDNAYHGITNDPLSMNQVNIKSLVYCFGLLVFLCATQDIAVDGWALTILSKQSLSYASTAQTVGLNMGYFLSFTVFLSLNSNEFINKYFRSKPEIHGWVSLGGYMKFAGIIYIILTIYLIYFTKEQPILERKKNQLPLKKDDTIFIDASPEEQVENHNIWYIYSCFVKMLKLKSVQTLVIVHLVAKIAFQCNESATNLKLLERGFQREDLSVAVLLDVPFEIIFGYYVAKWSNDADMSREYREKDHDNNNNKRSKKNLINLINNIIVGDAGVLTPWLYGYLGRLLAAMLGSFVLHHYPSDGNISKSYFLLVVIQHLLGSFMNTVQFVGISAFHTRIADPILGGTYMTLLNTMSNLGGTWPKFFIMTLINNTTVYKCEISTDYFEYLKGTPQECLYEKFGTATLVNEGYYTVNMFCCIFGLILYATFLRRNANILNKLPIEAWKVT